MIDKIKPIVIPLITLLISIIVITILIPDYHPFGDLNFVNNEEYVLENAKVNLKKIGVNYSKSDLNIKLEENKALSRWIKSENKINVANKILRDAGYGYYWSVSQNSDNNSEIVVSSNSNETTVNNQKNFKLNILDNGKIIQFDHQIIDTLLNNSLNPERAKNLAQNFIKIFREDIIFSDKTINPNDAINDDTFYFKEVETIEKPNRIDYNFIWDTKSSNLFYQTIKAQVVGNEVSRFSIEIIVPEEYQNTSTDIFEVATTIIFVILIVVGVIIVGFKRFRAYEVGFKHAIAFAVVVIISFVLKEFLEWINIASAEIIFGLLIGGVFIAGAAFILWAVSETLFREIWNQKFLSLDLIYHRKIVHSIVGYSIINSIAFGLGLTAVFIGLIFTLSNYSNFYFVGENFTSQTHLSANIPILNIFFGVFNAYGMLIVAFFMFLTASVKRYINNDIIFIIVCGLTWALFIPSGISALGVGIAVNFVIGILLSIILIKYDLLSTLLTYLLFKFFIKATQFSFLGGATFTNEWYLILVVGLSVLLFGIYTIIKNDKFIDYDSITPKFVENITERQRLKQELEVARHVQMSFLPKENPKLKGIDIDSICIPALEVGGDYYDFIKLGDNKLGIIIGDVSGKGTQAAFYMTLTKGFLKALAKQTESPAEVLTKMNELFYENVERGRFISMIYAVIDLQTNLIKVARAGHNPIIFQDEIGTINLINPKGLALGLEKGDLFGKVITEYEEKLNAGKLFIFYTDGFTEAINKKGEEYGLEKMFDIAKTSTQSSATEIKQKMVVDVNKFIGKAKQHDDMTMVVLKIV